MTSNQARGLDQLIAAMPFAASLGIQLDAAARGEVRGRLMWDTSRCTAGGVMHGGALMSFADSLGAICAFLGQGRRRMRCSLPG